MERIIWSRAKTLEKPEMLANVPCVYLDRQQRPLIGTTVDMKIYLSSKYDWVKDKATLRSLGVTEMTPSSFITKVTSFTQVSRKQYENESPEWHEDLCKAITTLPDMFWHSQIPSLPLIPLRNEQWMSAQQAGKEVFLDHDDGTPVPHGINILLVEPTAMKSAVRASLFRRLGLGPCDIQKVAHLILQKHKEGRRAISHRREAIQHLVYLYKARKTLSAVSLTDMWLSDIQNKACHGRDLYIDHPSDNLLRSLFKNNLSILRFVHPDFVSAVSGAEQAEWIDWLVSSMRLMTAPRLMENGKLSQAFKSIIANHSSTVWLKLLGDPQRNYNPRLSSDVCKELSNSQVVCTDGTLHTLGDTYLQTPELCQISQSFEKGSFWFVEVESPRDRAWEYLLGPLGVVTQIDIHFYARLLNNMKLRGSAVIAEVASIYTSMLQRSDCHLACIIFEKQALIPVVSSTQPRWLTSAQCVWKGPPGLRCRTSIESLYHGLERFFCGALGVKNATLDMVLDDLADLAGKTSKHDIQDVKSLLLAIPQCNENRSGDSKIKTLKGLELFPVQSAIVDGEISLMPCTAHFYISDRQRLRDAFVGEIPMLDFEVSAVHDLNTLIDILQLHHKLLSTTVTETCTTFGDSELDESFTKDLSGKAVALIRYVIHVSHAWGFRLIIVSCAFHYGSKEYEKHQDNLLDNLLRIEGWLADGIVSTLSLSYMGSTKQVNLPGNLLFEVTESKAVRICLPRDEEEAHMAYVMHLPARLIDYLDIPRDRSSIIHEILGLPNSRLKSVLDHYGVPEFKCNSSPHASRSELASIPTVSHHQVLEISIPPLTEDVSLVRQPQIPTADPQYVASNAIMKDSRSSKIRVNAQPRQLKCSKTPVESLTSMMRTLDQGKFIQGSSSKIGNAPISKHTVLQLVSSDRINQVTSSAKIYSQALPVAVTSAHRIPILDETTYMFDTATPIEPRSSKDSCIRSPKISATHLTSQDDGGLTIGFSGELFVSSSGLLERYVANKI